ncbi:uncharacterized protein KGF55_000162 [Candida pseudojiufengensis]|uniref:uncharacterized protein n=1 Tax=Candida pseudojiufengensis TaxID=497109 RepID=UPI002224AE71|nr:uncharacterized protein KGF55_000162 [Candida pseudojiufengensis]KAI5966753.1 hypothetical protein KGF55_000162 [Candida pseudojiufengensis]
MRRLKIGIRPQLIVLVCFASLFSLLILGIVTGLYFSDNLTDLRSERLFVISQLKTTQVQQAVAFVAYQVMTLASIDAITTPLSQYRAGNNSRSVFTNAQETLEQFMQSTETFAFARLYNLDLQIMASSTNNATIVSPTTRDALFPLQQNQSIPNQISNDESGYYFTGPLTNDSQDINSAYFMGVTLPVYANTSILIDTPYIAGYLSIIASASTIQNALNATSEDYSVIAVKPIYGDSNNGIDNLNDEGVPSGASAIGFQTVFPVENSLLKPGEIYNINSSTSVRTAINSPYGTSTDVKSYSGQSVAIGFTQILLNNLLWVIIVVQEKSVFNGPVERLKRIIIGVVIGIGAFMVLITLPFAVWFIRPITKLKESAEDITRLKKEKKMINEKQQQTLTNTRGSVTSTNSGASQYSTGIRLPKRIQPSKKFFKDELTELSEAFNIMTDELDKQYTHLEDRVKLRTKELEASKIEAETANEAKTVFIANISHELRTPLNGILGMTSIAMEENDAEKIQDSLKLIHRSGELLLHILTELLTYSKNTLNRSKLEKSNFQILEIVYQINSIFNKLALDQRVNFKLSVKPNIFRKLILYGDSNRIIQIIMNLVSNSLKFTPVDGSVNVIFKLLGEYDYEKSKENNFEKVFIMESDSESRPHPQQHNTDATLVSDLLTTEQEDSVSPTDINDNKNNDKHNDKHPLDDDESDVLSITTLSTTQYEKALFDQQFKNKSLPPSPKTSIDDSSVTKNSNSSDEHEPENEQKQEEVDEQTSIKPTTPTDNKDLYVMPEAKDFKSYPTLHKKEYEGDKSFKIRNIYNSKTWVIQIEVKDTGSGIEPSLQEKVFEPFVQGDQTLSRSYGGTGLGLSICRQLAKMMNGTLNLKSIIGKGSIFTLTLPLPQTGEIMISPEELNEFCNDEFNPYSKINRKVVFNDETIEINDNNNPIMNDDENNNNNNVEGIPIQNQGLKKSSSKQPMIFSKSSTGTAQSSSNNDSNPPSIKIDLENSNTTTTTRPSLNSNNNSSNSVSKLINIPSNNSIINSEISITNENNIPPPQSTTTPTLTPQISKSISNLKILVAEDNQVNQEVIKRMLKLEGFNNLTMCANGKEAVEIIKNSMLSIDSENTQQEEQFDLIFMDVQMPIMDGISAVKIIRNQLKFTNLIIALTAFADDSNIKECFNVGMNGFLSKPIKRSNLKKILDQYF